MTGKNSRRHPETSTLGLGAMGVAAGALEGAAAAEVAPPTPTCRCGLPSTCTA